MKRASLRFSAFLFLLVLTACHPAMKLTKSDATVVLTQHSISAPDPSSPGNHRVLRLVYGSGKDKNREVYRSGVTLTTPPVDASKLVDLGTTAKSRNKYWGLRPRTCRSTRVSGIPRGPAPFRSS